MPLAISILPLPPSTVHHSLSPVHIPFGIHSYETRSRNSFRFHSYKTSCNSFTLRGFKSCIRHSYEFLLDKSFRMHSYKKGGRGSTQKQQVLSDPKSQATFQAMSKLFSDRCPSISLGPHRARNVEENAHPTRKPPRQGCRRSPRQECRAQGADAVILLTPAGSSALLPGPAEG
jgi:hypothetical protein